jgi:hypothetical protein
VSRRIEPWKAIVERVQRRTGGGVSWGGGKGERGGRTEKHVLEYDRLLGEPAKVDVAPAGGIGVGGGLAALDACPGEVDVEEEEEDAEADDGGL